MIKPFLVLSLLVSFSLGQKRTPAMYWESLEMKEKVAFVNGVYAAGAKLKFHHRQEVKKQFNQDPNWVEPYYIERFYEIVDEHRSKKAGYQVNLVAEAMDAFYSNYDNTAIPIAGSSTDRFSGSGWKYGKSRSLSFDGPKTL